MAQKQDIAAALRESLKGEEKAIQDRFERAETIINEPDQDSKGRRPKRSRATEKATQEKVVRDTFCMPKRDHDLIEELRQRALRAGVRSSKSEIIRAGLKLLSHCTKQDLKEIFAELHKVALGRPKA